MDVVAVNSLWEAYRESRVSSEIHPADSMYNTGKDWYYSVGLSAIRAISSALVAGPTMEVGRIFDFGCGYGRVARHLCSAFPNSRLFFCDQHAEAAKFCATTFRGEVVGENDLPSNIDLLWVGSVFTHLDVDRSRILLQRLLQLLAINGILVATFHGRRVIEIAKRTPYIRGDRWSRILAGYEMVGSGYESYGREDLGDYGVSLMSAATIVSLAHASGIDYRLVSYQEAGWANHQDVAAWARQSLA
jgi:SAM-dependent methyltransferase